MELSFQTIDTERRLYGKRYTGLPVDHIDRHSLRIDCGDGLLRPEMFDLQPGDTVRWLRNGRYVQGKIASITRDATTLSATLEGVEPLPPDFFPW